jgi:hypothetical protein
MSSLQQEFVNLSVRQRCALLSVSRSWFYARPQAPTQAERDVALRDAIARIVLEFPGHGYRRVTAELHRQQWEGNHKRVLRMMRAEALRCQLQRSWGTTTDAEGKPLQRRRGAPVTADPVGWLQSRVFETGEERQQGGHGQLPTRPHDRTSQVSKRCVRTKPSPRVVRLLRPTSGGECFGLTAAFAFFIFHWSYPCRTPIATRPRMTTPITIR